MRPIRFNRFIAIFTLAGFALIAAAPGAQAAKSKSTQNEAEWVSFDEANKQVTVKITRGGRGPNKKMLKKGKEANFNVIPTG